ncbi:hypothetical protein LLH00_00650 [bacterium]|nr:hypothetical protein [bacterium]
MFNHADSCFGFFFTGAELVTGDSTRACVRLSLLAGGAGNHSLRLGLLSSGPGGAQVRWNILGGQADGSALSLALLDVTRSAWTLPVMAGMDLRQALSLFLTGASASSGQSVLRVRVVERFTN